MKELLITLINFYQKYLSLDRGMLSILVPGGACKFEVSCSEYMKQSIVREGVFTGVLKGLRRFLSCR